MSIELYSFDLFEMAFILMMMLTFLKKFKNQNIYITSNKFTFMVLFTDINRL